MVKPHQLVLFGLAVGIPLCLLLFIHPTSGLPVIGDVRLQYPTPSDVFGTEYDSTSADTIDILAGIRDPAERQRILDSIEARRFAIHYPNDDMALFASLFADLSVIATAKKPLHILHFGGSQIEGDRITEDLRAKLQAKFGGRGPGWLPAVPFVGSRSFTIEYSENWKRYALYGVVDSTVQHNHYGAMGLYAMFTEPRDSFSTDTTRTHAWINYQSRGGSDTNVKSFNKLNLFYGYLSHPVNLRIVGTDATVIHEAVIQPAEKTSVFKYNLPQARRQVRLEFDGIESPEIYGVSLEGTSGVMVSNISLRGQAGTHFWTQPSHQLRTMFGTSNIRLLILQFGANAVPYSTTDAKITEYCNRFGKNIAYLKKLIPGVSVLVIGPADMAKKEGTNWVSYPLLPKIRDAMEQTAFAAGAAYWDPYAAMGGAGTIQQWVMQTPPLASNDHVHFTIDGADQIAQWVYDALMHDYERYLTMQSTEGTIK